MAVIELGQSDWESIDEDVPRIRLRNMYVDQNPASPDQSMRISRPTLIEYTTIGTGPIQGMWRQDGSLSGDWLIVSGFELYRLSPGGSAELLGAVGGVGCAQFAGTSDRVIVVRGGVAYSTDGETVTTVTMPDDLLVGAVGQINSYFLLSILDDDKIFWIDPGETDPDALSFFTAERGPDPIVSINIVSDEVWFLGSAAPEVWTATGDSLSPFQRVSGRVYSDGCLDRDTAVVSAKDGFPALLWVTAARSVALSQGSPKKVSNGSVEELLKDATGLRAWAFRSNRHDFYVLTSDTFTLVYDINTSVWAKWDSYGLDYWRAHLGLQTEDSVYAGDATNGTLYRLSKGLEDVSEPVVREVSGHFPLQGKPVSCASVVLKVNAGWSPSYTYEPILEMRWSDDQGATWSNYYPASLGNRGRYTTRVIYRSLGLMQAPGRTFEFRFAGPARLRIDYALVNEA